MPRSVHPIRPVRPMLFRWFLWVARSRLRSSFRALRIANGDTFPQAARPGVPLVVYLNHPSWWDPLVGFALAAHLVPGRSFYAPIDSSSLVEYPILKHLGMFPVEVDSRRGAVQFFKSAREVLESGGVLAMTPQGKFTDAAERPLQFKPGLAALLLKLAEAGVEVEVVPVALEYTFWNERLPEALANVGESFSIFSGETPTDLKAWDRLLVDRLEKAQDTLRSLAIRRDPLLFRTVLEGGRGMAGFYGLIRRLRWSHESTSQDRRGKAKVRERGDL